MVSYYAIYGTFGPSGTAPIVMFDVVASQWDRTRRKNVLLGPILGMR